MNRQDDICNGNNVSKTRWIKNTPTAEYSSSNEKGENIADNKNNDKNIEIIARERDCECDASSFIVWFFFYFLRDDSQFCILYFF